MSSARIFIISENYKDKTMDVRESKKEIKIFKYQVKNIYHRSMEQQNLWEKWIKKNQKSSENLLQIFITNKIRRLLKTTNEKNVCLQKHLKRKIYHNHDF